MNSYILVCVYCTYCRGRPYCRPGLYLFVDELAGDSRWHSVVHHVRWWSAVHCWLSRRHHYLPGIQVITSSQPTAITASWELAILTLCAYMNTQMAIECNAADCSDCRASGSASIRCWQPPLFSLSASSSLASRGCKFRWVHYTSAKKCNVI